MVSKKRIRPPAEKIREWKLKAQKKGAIVPHYFEVFPTRVELVCGKCAHEYRRPLVMNIDEPVFVCPKCTARNWVPVTFDLR